MLGEHRRVEQPPQLRNFKRRPLRALLRQSQLAERVSPLNVIGHKTVIVRPDADRLNATQLLVDGCRRDLGSSGCSRPHAACTGSVTRNSFPSRKRGTS
jgi:hypothetical protein